METKIYKTIFSVQNQNGDEQFSITRLFSDRKTAFDYLFDLTNKRFPQELDKYLYPDRISLYARIILYKDNNGEFERVRGAYYSYSEPSIRYDEEGNEIKSRVTQCNENELKNF